jgi:hypothetical protein
LRQQWAQFETSAVLGEQFLAKLWARNEESPELLIGLMINYDLIFELPSEHERKFLVPAMLPHPSDLVEEVVSGRVVRVHALLEEALPADAIAEPTQPLRDWEVPNESPACYFVFAEKQYRNTAVSAVGPAGGFIPEGLWFALLVKCARWAQHTDSAWSEQHLAESFRRDVARFSFGSQQFELKLHRAEHAIRLVVLGECEHYPMGVLQRVRSLVDGTLQLHFPVVQYFVALRVEGDDASKLVDFDVAIAQVTKRMFCTTDSFTSSITVGTSESGIVALDRDEINFCTCHPWAPTDPDRVFDIYICHADADTEFATKVHDCLAKCNTKTGHRVRVFLKNVSFAHTFQLVTEAAALQQSRLFVPLVSMDALVASGAIENQSAESEPVPWFSAVEAAFRRSSAKTPAGIANDPAPEGALESGHLLDCMLASELQHATVPLILDSACKSAELSSDVVPVHVMELFASRNVSSGKHNNGRPRSRRISSVLGRIISSKKAVDLWDGGGGGGGHTSPYEAAARALTAELDRLPLDDRQQQAGEKKRGGRQSAGGRRGSSGVPRTSAGTDLASAPPPRQPTGEAIIQRVKGGQLHAKIPYTELQAVTGGFSKANRLAGGGSCVVYKAELYGTAVAVKHLELSSPPGATEQHPDAGGEIQFAAECELLMRIAHPAICRMLGFSTDGPQRCIVLELCAGGSLEERLACEAVQGRRARPPLPWDQRVRIAVDMADALVYLHTLQPKPMLHRDVKTANCLLDEAGQAKVSGERARRYWRTN